MESPELSSSTNVINSSHSYQKHSHQQQSMPNISSGSSAEISSPPSQQPQPTLLPHQMQQQHAHQITHHPIHAQPIMYAPAFFNPSAQPTNHDGTHPQAAYFHMPPHPFMPYSMPASYFYGTAPPAMPLQSAQQSAPLQPHPSLGAHNQPTHLIGGSSNLPESSPALFGTIPVTSYLENGYSQQPVYYATSSSNDTRQPSNLGSTALPPTSFSSIELPEIFPFNIDFGELTRVEIDKIMSTSDVSSSASASNTKSASSTTNPSKRYISWYSTWNEIRKGKREKLLTIGKSPNVTPISVNNQLSPRQQLFQIPALPLPFPSTPASDAVDTQDVRIVAIEKQEPSKQRKSSQDKSTNHTTEKHTSSANGASSAPSWASLFQNSSSSTKMAAELSQATSNHYQSQVIDHEGRSKNQSIRRKSIPKPVVKEFIPDLRPVSLIPRGLVNRGNFCFMNSILQPLLHCYPLFRLLKTTADSVPLSPVSGDLSPISKSNLMEAMISLFREFAHSNFTKSTQQYDNDDTLITGESLLPEFIYDALQADSRFKSTKGRQEDAEEFLGFLLDGLHEEFVNTQKELAGTNERASAETDSEWVEVGPKNRHALTKSIEVEESPITKIFGGHLRSVLKCPGQKDSITIEPFHTLQLEISAQDEGTPSVVDALKNLTRPETIDGYTSANSGGTPVAITKQMLLDKVPPVLILHIKRFVYDQGMTKKLHTTISYPPYLNLPQELFPASFPPSRKNFTYRLFAVVYHHGRSATDGHYTADILRADGKWLNFDDTTITSIPESAVFPNFADVLSNANSSTQPTSTQSSPIIKALSTPISSPAMTTITPNNGCAYLLFYMQCEPVSQSISHN